MDVTGEFMKLNFLISLYRDSYFYKEYGPSVRDLQILETLANSHSVSSITSLNRPVSIIEKCLGRKSSGNAFKIDKVTTIDGLSKDLLGPLRGRTWAHKVYPKLIEDSLAEFWRDDCVNIFLDFLPIGRFSEDSLKGWLYWYDFIDNFVKHNRFSVFQKLLVEDKYQFVEANAHVVTGVSKACLSSRTWRANTDSLVLSNKVFFPSLPEIVSDKNIKPEFQLGFLGFITDKFDLTFIKNIAEKYSIAIYGKFLDKRVYKELKKIPNVYLGGKFKYSDIPQIMGTFKVGLIPYLEDKSHDESPLKLYEYMKFNRPCITSTDFEITEVDFLVNYNNCRFLLQEVDRLIDMSGSDKISSSMNQDWYLSNAIESILNIISEKGL